MAPSRTTSSFSRIALLGAALVCASAPRAFAEDAGATTKPAEPSASDIETAKAQFTEGLDLRDKGDVAGALQRFRAAFALVPTPITALELGRTLVAAGKVLEGREVLLDASRMPKKPDESDKAQQARDDAARAADAAKSKLASLAIETDFEADPVVVVDDTPIPKDALRAPRMLDPGHHVVVVHAKGKVGRAELDLREGEQRQLQVEPDQDEGGPHPKPPPPHGRLHPNTLVYVGGIGTGASLIVGIATGIGALATAATVKRECPSQQCPPAFHGDLNTSLALGWTSTFAFAAAGAFAIVGVIGLATSHRTPAPIVGRLQLDVGAGTLLLRGTF